jgi:hypothetical protein
MNEDKTLRDLTREYFSRKYQYSELQQTIRGKSGAKWKFDAMIDYNGKKFCVFIRDWDRSIGVNQIRQLEKACRDTQSQGIVGGVIVGNQFSGMAENFSENLGVQVVDRSTLISKLNSGI